VAILLITKAPITMPRGTAAISSPTVSALPCRERVWRGQALGHDVKAGQPAEQQQGQQQAAAEHDPDVGRRHGPQRGPDRAGATWRRAAPHPGQEDEGGQAERHGVDAQRLVRVEHGDDGGARHEAENLAGPGR
jgi:hypothetical protein